MLMLDITKTNWIGKSYLYKEEIDSTNSALFREAKELPHGTVMLAEGQTAGIGRRGRTWHSPKGENLYFSVLLKPDFAPDKAPMLTLLMALAVARAIAKVTGGDAKIKWPNDIVLQNKKVCGILTQMQVAKDIDAQVVIGVGINVNQQVFDEDALPYASSIQKELQKSCDRKQLLETLLLEFETLYERFADFQHLGFVKAEYEKFLINREKSVRVLDPKGEYEAVALGINELGELMVQKEDGTTEAIYAGEVSVRGLYGYV